MNAASLLQPSPPEVTLSALVPQPVALRPRFNRAAHFELSRKLAALHPLLAAHYSQIELQSRLAAFARRLEIVAKRTL